MPIFTKKLFAENYIVTSSVTSMSIAQASGSTIFGDSADDTHLFIGSTISGSASSTASFGKYENITSFAGAGGTEALFSGSAASTGSFGRVDVDDTLNVGTRIEGIGDTLEIKNAELKFSGNGGQVTFGSNTAGWFHSSGRTYVRKDAGFTDYAFKAVDYPSAAGFWVDTVGRMIFGTGMDFNIYDMMTLGHQPGHASGSLLVSGSIISAEGDISGSAASTGSFGTLKLSNANGDVDIRNYVDGDMNVVIGDSTTGAALTSGVDNIIIGQGIAAIQTGGNNVYIGARAGAANNAVNNNVAIGYQAMVNGNNNSNNVAIGYRALYGNGSSINNTAVGYEAGKNTTNGEESVFLGFRSGDTNTTGDKNVTLGVGADVSTADAQNQIAIGFNATSTGDNQTVIGNSDQTHVVFGGSAIISGSATSTGSFGVLGVGTGSVDGVFVASTGGEWNRTLEYPFQLINMDSHNDQGMGLLIQAGANQNASKIFTARNYDGNDVFSIGGGGTGLQISGSAKSTGSFGHLNIDGPGLTISDNNTPPVSGNSSVICVGSGSMPVYYGNVVGVKHATNAVFKLQTDVSGSEVGSGYEMSLGGTASLINREIIDHVVYGTANTETMRHHYHAAGNIVGIHSGYVGLANHGGAGITLGGLNSVTRVKVCSSTTGIDANAGL